MSEKVQIRQYTSLTDCTNHLDQQECKNLGWLNSGKVEIPENSNFVCVYSNRSGSSTCYCDVDLKLYFLCDEGD